MSEPEFRQCRKCGELKPLTPEFWYERSTACKACRKAAALASYERNRPTRLARGKNYNAQNPERHKEANKRWYERKKARIAMTEQKSTELFNGIHLVTSDAIPRNQIMLYAVPAPHTPERDALRRIFECLYEGKPIDEQDIKTALPYFAIIRMDIPPDERKDS